MAMGVWQGMSWLEQLSTCKYLIDFGYCKELVVAWSDRYHPNGWLTNFKYPLCLLSHIGKYQYTVAYGYTSSFMNYLLWTEKLLASNRFLLS